jgi:hypothetical protein
VFQAKVREEIKATRAQATQRGDSELTIADLDGMSNLIALMKVGIYLISLMTFD